MRRGVPRKVLEAMFGGPLPTTAEARRIARATGGLVADRTGRYRNGLSDAERKAREAELDEIWDLTRAVLELADAKADPVELAKKLEYWHCGDIRAKSPKALAWLQKFEEAIRERTDLT
jgi:hypothetical protein